MIVACPSCRAKFKIDEGRIKPPGVRLRCARCQNLFAVRKRVVDKPVTAEQAPEPSAAAGREPGAGEEKVLVAHGEPLILASLREILEKEKYEVLTSADGVDALMKIQREQPEAAVIDVALPKMYGFEICEFLKRNESLSATKVILVATEHKHRRYKRTPENFYGADDVIEEHDIQSGLAARIRRILHGEPESPGAGGSEEVPPGAPADAPSPAEPLERGAGDLHDAGTAVAPPFSEPDLEPAPAPPPAEPGGEGQDAAREKACRLARIIVSDIALYNPETVERGIRDGGLPALIRDDLEEGYRLFRSRIDEAVAGERDFIREALDAFVDRKRRDLGLGEAAPADQPVEESAVPDDAPLTGVETGHDDF